MKLELKIIIGWLCLLGLIGASLLAPHRELAWIGIVNVAVNVLLAVLCVLIAHHLSSRAQKATYIVLALHFGYSLFLFSGAFVGTAVMPQNPYATFYYHFFVNKVGFNFLWAFTVFTLAATAFWPRRNALVILAAAAGLSLALIIPMYMPYLTDPLQLRERPDYALLQEMQGASAKLKSTLGREPDASEIAVALSDGGRAHQGTTELTASVERLRVYLAEGGTTMLFWKPVDTTTAEIMAGLAVILALLLAYIWRSDIAIHPYFDKLVSILLLLGVVEAIHAFGFISATSHPVYTAFVVLGQYVTIVCELLFVAALDLKLRFVLSHAGKYYEYALAEDPRQVTRWKDELDRYIIRTFFTGDKQARLAETVSRDHDV